MSGLVSGIVGMRPPAPAQPAVFANNSSADTDVTGNNEFPEVDYDTEIFDQGGDFTADTFTAPVTGIYFISAAVGMGDQDDAAITKQLRFVASSRTISGYYSTGKVAGSDFNHSIFRAATIMDMDAGDTLAITVRVNGQTTEVDITDSGTYISICHLA